MAVTAPSTSRGRDTRARIVSAAAELVAAKGAIAVSLDDVGARSHTSRSQLYHYFEDKDDLIRAVVATTTDAVLKAQEQQLEQLDSWAGIGAWFDTLVAFQEQVQARGGCPIGSLAGQLAERDERARLALVEGFDRWQSHLVHGLEQMRGRGELRGDADLAALATATMASLQGGLLLTQVRRDPGQLRLALDGALANLRTAAAPEQPRP